MIDLESVLAWLRAAYPQGPSHQDFAPLVKVLRLTLGEQRTDQLVTYLDINGLHNVADHLEIRESGALDRAEHVAVQDANDVAARLARAGWPLAGPAVDKAAEQPGYLSRVMNWLRAGYPQGVPPTDYIPVLAVLRRQLTEEEVETVAYRLSAEARAAGTAPSEEDARAAILQTIDEKPTEEEVERVKTRLEAHGWPFVENCSPSL